MNFIYSIEDYEKTPGLYREWDKENPALVPVFFEKSCLTNFFYNNEYECNLCSETYGSISNENFDIPFGINKNNKIIFWLCDLKSLPEKEQKMLLPFNVESDHDIVSEFYDAQINVVFTENILEFQILLEKNKINEKFGFSIFKDIGKNTDVLLKKCGQYKKMMFNREDDFKRIISELSEDLIEDIDKESLVKKIGSEIGKELGSIKLFEKYIVDKYVITENLFSPYYILYDLRIWADHKDAQNKFDSSVKRLGLGDVGYEIIYKKLIEELLKMNRALMVL